MKGLYIAKELLTPLTHLFNLSLRSGVMPTLWKPPNTTPVHNGYKKELVENYRSMSLLPIPAKCLRELYVMLPSYFLLLNWTATWLYQGSWGHVWLSWSWPIFTGRRLLMIAVTWTLPSWIFLKLLIECLVEKVMQQSSGASGSLRRWGEYKFKRTNYG